MTTETSFAALIAISREHNGQTAAEFDYCVASAGKRHYRDCFRDAAYILARRQLVPSDPQFRNPLPSGISQEQVYVVTGEILDRYAADIDAFGAAAQQKKFTGWSDGNGKIRYAQ